MSNSEGMQQCTLSGLTISLQSLCLDKVRFYQTLVKLTTHQIMYLHVYHLHIPNITEKLVLEQGMCILAKPVFFFFACSYFFIHCSLFVSDLVRTDPCCLSPALCIVSVVPERVGGRAGGIMWFVVSYFLELGSTSGASKDLVTTRKVEGKSHVLPAARVVFTPLDRIPCFEHWHCSTVLDTSIVSQKPLWIEYF